VVRKNKRKSVELVVEGIQQNITSKDVGVK
jgi:hypothetical protein